MKMFGATFLKILPIIVATIFQISCSRLEAKAPLSVDAAAQLAAKSANDRCEQLYHKRPSVPNQYVAKLQNGAYRWGNLDVGGKKGFSALVTFRQDGSEPHVEIYFSTDVF